MNEYLVLYRSEGETYYVKSTADKIFDKMDMDDCYDIHLEKLWILKPDGLKRCHFYGTWHDGNDPLRMEIRYGKKVLDVGYGTDH